MPGARSRRSPPGDENAAKEAASRQPRVQLLGLLFEKLALGLADLQRRGMAEMSEIVEVIVEPFELREQNAKRSSANGRFAASGALDGLTISERVGDAFRPRRPARR